MGCFAAKADGHDNVQQLVCVVAMKIGIEVTAAARTDDIGDLVRNCPVIGQLQAILEKDSIGAGIAVSSFDIHSAPGTPQRPGLSVAACALEFDVSRLVSLPTTDTKAMIPPLFNTFVFD